MKQGITERSKFGLMLVLGMLLQSCVSVGPNYKDATKAAQLNAQIGAELLQKGNLVAARDKLERALKQDNKNALAHLTYAQLQHVVDEPEKAKEHFGKAIKIEPDVADHRNAYGIFLCQTKDYDAAEEQFEVAANNKFYSTPEFALDNAGVCMLDANRLDRAESYLRKALQVNPTFASTYLHMAELLYKRQRLTVAEAYFERYRSYGRETAAGLLLGVRINRDTGRTDVAEQYASRLLNDFPNSREAGEYLSRPQQ